MADNKISSRTLRALIDKFGKEVVENQKKNLKAIDTGELLRSISYKYVVNAETVIVNFLSLDYGQWVDSGRKKGSYPPISPLKGWVKRKGMPEKAAYGVARNIFKFGIKPRPFLMVGYDQSKQEFINELLKLEQTKIVENLIVSFGGK